MDKKKRITVQTKGIHGNRTRTFYDAQYYVNVDTRGILFSGQDTPSNRKGKPILADFIPFQLIIQVDIEDYDGGRIVCKNMEWLLASVDIYESMSVTEMVERLR